MFAFAAGPKIEVLATQFAGLDFQRQEASFRTSQPAPKKLRICKKDAWAVVKRLIWRAGNYSGSQKAHRFTRRIPTMSAKFAGSERLSWDKATSLC